MVLFASVGGFELPFADRAVILISATCPRCELMLASESEVRFLRCDAVIGLESSAQEAAPSGSVGKKVIALLIQGRADNAAERATVACALAVPGALPATFDAR